MEFSRCGRSAFLLGMYRGFGLSGGNPPHNKGSKGSKESTRACCRRHHVRTTASVKRCMGTSRTEPKIIEPWAVSRLSCKNFTLVFLLPGHNMLTGWTNRPPTGCDPREQRSQGNSIGGGICLSTHLSDRRRNA